MIFVHTLPEIRLDQNNDWLFTLWVGEAFDYDIPFRPILGEIAALIGAQLELPAYSQYEDLVQGSLMYDGHTVSVYYEH
jgi:hypothetical protein